MPLNVQIDENQQVIFVRGEGIVTDQELLDYVREYLGDSRYNIYDELIDLTEADLQDLTYAGLSELASVAAATDPEAIPIKIAILISQSLGMGLSRIYTRLREFKGGRRQVRVFWDRDECMEWLGLIP